MPDPLWLHRRLLNWRDVYAWGIEHGVRKMMPPEQLHVTLATVRVPVEWADEDFALELGELTVPAGPKPVQIFGYTLKALAFSDLRIERRHEVLLARFPQMDHPMLRPHVTVFRGGKMPKASYHGELVFGPEIAEVFSEANGRNIKHVRIDGYNPE
ncbi:MAG TPA: hypothetical protein VIA98_12305 [Allosphingosinicella sp.]|jgi:2'-5' RNA ligase